MYIPAIFIKTTQSSFWQEWSVFSCLGTTKEPIVCQHQQEKENSRLILDFNLKSIGRPACFSAF